jgi:molecular chaperone DnaK (HSP70)
MEKSEFNFYQEEDELAIGLDLGTTLSCIGVYKNGTVEIIKNKKGEPITPSVVIINDSNILVGEDTTDFLVKYYDTCIYEIKRLIGKKISEKSVQKDIEKLPFKIVKSNDDTPMIEINSHGIPIKYSPVEISSFVIKKMINNAEKQLNKKINKLVITVPAYFSDSQRKLTKQAAELVGLKVLRVINEPTAAALAYCYNETLENNKNILVFDLGGGFFEVSILSLKKKENEPDFKEFEVLGTSGAQLGGKDFDIKLIDYFLNELEHKDVIKKNKKYIQKLKIN